MIAVNNNAANASKQPMNMSFNLVFEQINCHIDNKTNSKYWLYYSCTGKVKLNSFTEGSIDCGQDWQGLQNLIKLMRDPLYSVSKAINEGE